VLALETVLREGITERDIGWVLSLDEHVGLADCERLAVQFLAEHDELGVGVQVPDVLLGYREHPARATCWIIERPDYALIR
jgi:hypothetical protein